MHRWYGMESAQRAPDATGKHLPIRILFSVHSSVKFDDFLDRWFSEYATKQLKPKTVSDYRRMRPRVSAALGHMRLDEIRPAHLMALYANLSEGGVRQDSTFVATPALLKKLPRGQRAAVRKAAGIGEETSERLVQRQTCQPPDCREGSRCRRDDLLQSIY